MGSLRKASRRGKGTGRKATGRKGTRGTRHKVRKIGRKATGRKATGRKGRKIGRKGTRRKSRKYRQRGGMEKLTDEQDLYKINSGHAILPTLDIIKKDASGLKNTAAAAAAKQRVINYFNAVGGLNAYKEGLKKWKENLATITEQYFYVLLHEYGLLDGSHPDIQINYEDFSGSDAIKGIDENKFNEIIRNLWDKSGNTESAKPKETHIDTDKTRPNSIYKFFFEHKKQQLAFNRH